MRRLANLASKQAQAHVCSFMMLMYTILRPVADCWNEVTEACPTLIEN